METRLSTICNRRGLHARAAAKFVKLAEQYSAHIWVSKQHQEHSKQDTEKVSGRSILGLMMLGADKGSVLQLEAEGEDASKALQAIAVLVESRFGEEE